MNNVEFWRQRIWVNAFHFVGKPLASQIVTGKSAEARNDLIVDINPRFKLWYIGYSVNRYDGEIPDCDNFEVLPRGEWEKLHYAFWVGSELISGFVWKRDPFANIEGFFEVANWLLLLQRSVNSQSHLLSLQIVWLLLEDARLECEGSNEKEVESGRGKSRYPSLPGWLRSG
jgi:hypothetical protein